MVDFDSTLYKCTYVQLTEPSELSLHVPPFSQDSMSTHCPETERELKVKTGHVTGARHTITMRVIE